MANLLPLADRAAAKAAARAAIAKALSEEQLAADMKLKAAEKAAASASATLAEAEAREHAEARQQCARTIRLRCITLASELLKHETLECTRDFRAEWRACQRNAVKFTGNEMSLMILRVVGHDVITRAPETKARIARLDTIQTPYSHCAAVEIAAAHKALMADKYDDRSARDAVFALERRLTEIGRSAVPDTDNAEFIWECVGKGMTYYEIEPLVRARGIERMRKEAEASSKTPEGTAFRITNGWAKLRNITAGDSPL